MILKYNGVSLQIEHVMEFVQEAVYHEKDYLYTHARIVVRAVWSPVATSALDAVFQGVSAAKSMNANNLRRDLMTPRKSLRIGIPGDGLFPIATNPDGVEFVVRSPDRRDANNDYLCDVNHGPLPLYCNPVEIAGQDTMIVDYAIETWFIECGDAHAIISNRYTMAHDIDEDCWTTRTTQGTAIFRADFLENLNLAPAGLGVPQGADDYRSRVLPPIPSRFKRIDTHVELSPDGSTMNYMVVDEEQPQSINEKYRVISRIDGHYAESMGDLSGAADVALRAIGGIAAWAGFGDPSPTPSGSGPAPSRGWRRRAAGTVLAASAGIAAYPLGTIELVATVYGTRLATRRSLINTLARVLAGFNFGNVGALPSWLFSSSAFTFDLFERSASVVVKAELTIAKLSAMRIASPQWRLGLGELGALAADANSVFPDAIPGREPGQAFDPADTTNDVTTTSNVSTTNPPYDGGTRGLLKARVLAARLKSPCDDVEIPEGGIVGIGGGEPFNPANVQQVANAAPANNAATPIGLALQAINASQQAALAARQAADGYLKIS